MGTITPAMKHFLSADKFAVIGRVLTDESRWDNKVLRWYKDRGLPVTPVRPGKGGQAEGMDVITDANDLPDLRETSISILINPAISLSILQSLYPSPSTGDEPHAVWFQPGADDEKVRKFVKERNLEDRVVLGGRCVLVDGDRGLQTAKEAGTSKL